MGDVVDGGEADLHPGRAAGEGERDVSVDPLDAVAAPVGDHRGGVGDGGDGLERGHRLAGDGGYRDLPGDVTPRVLVLAEVVGPGVLGDEEGYVRLGGRRCHGGRRGSRALGRRPDLAGGVLAGEQVGAGRPRHDLLRAVPGRLDHLGVEQRDAGAVAYDAGADPRQDHPWWPEQIDVIARGHQLGGAAEHLDLVLEAASDQAAGGHPVHVVLGPHAASHQRRLEAVIGAPEECEFHRDIIERVLTSDSVAKTGKE